MKTFRILLAGLLSVLLLGASPASSPEETFRHFVDKVRAGDVDAAWQLLSKRSQERLTELVRQHSAASEGKIPNDPKRVGLGHADLVRPIDQIERLGAEGDRVTIRVRSEGESQEVILLREDGAWKVELATP